MSSSSSIGGALDENVALLKDVFRHLQQQQENKDSTNKNNNKQTDQSHLDNIHSAKVCSIPGRRGLALGAAVTTTKNDINNVFGIFQPSGGVFSEEFRIPNLLARRCFPLHIGQDVAAASQEKNNTDEGPETLGLLAFLQAKTKVTSAAIVETDSEEFVFIIVEENRSEERRVGKE